MVIGLVLTSLALLCAAGFASRAQPRPSEGASTVSDFPTDGPYHYKVEYLGIVCGHMTLESRLEKFQGRSAYHVTMTACNAKFFNKIYKVDGQINSWVDAESMSTLAYQSDITEKGKRSIRSYEIDHENGVVRANKDGKVKTIPFEGLAALDPLAYVYRGRALAAAPGSTFHLDLLTDRGVVATASKVGGLKKFRTPDGELELLRVQPMTADGEMFSRKGAFVYWITPAAEKTLYRLDFDLPFGRLLATYTGPAAGPVDRRAEELKSRPGSPDGGKAD